MYKYRISKPIEDEVIAPTHYEAFLVFRERYAAGYYGPEQKDVEFVEEVTETETSTPGE